MTAHFLISNAENNVSNTRLSEGKNNIMPQSILLIILVCFWVLIAVAGCNLAKKRNRNQSLWFINCMTSGLFGLLVVACSSTLDYDEELDIRETDTLGWIIFFISLIMLGLSIWYGYLEFKAYSDRMFWNSYFMMY
ncbi:MAG: hypothetical protein HDR97_02270 [Bacteroides sp.]|nr:hypothetical protein [Bacteroides sp.]MBD5332565.1 hypothetical protein [Bacteroides sp.]